MRRQYRDYPALVQAVEKRHLVYNKTLDYIRREEKAGRVFVIRPDGPAGIGRVEKNREKLEKLYCRGYDTARKQGQKLQEFLKGENTISSKQI